PRPRVRREAVPRSPRPVSTGSRITGMAHFLSTGDSRLAAGARIILPAVWLGLIIGISLIEAPLEFTAPGITIPLGLGIGRLVFGVRHWVGRGIGVILLWAMLKSSVSRGHRSVRCGLFAGVCLTVVGG